MSMVRGPVAARRARGPAPRSVSRHACSSGLGRERRLSAGHRVQEPALGRRAHRLGQVERARGPSIRTPRALERAQAALEVPPRDRRGWSRGRGHGGVSASSAQSYHASARRTVPDARRLDTSRRAPSILNGGSVIPVARPAQRRQAAAHPAGGGEGVRAQGLLRRAGVRDRPQGRRRPTAPSTSTSAARRTSSSRSSTR